MHRVEGLIRNENQRKEISQRENKHRGKGRVQEINGGIRGETELFHQS